MSPINFGIGDIHTRITRLFFPPSDVSIMDDRVKQWRGTWGGDGKCETDLELQRQTEKKLPYLIND